MRFRRFAHQKFLKLHQKYFIFSQKLKLKKLGHSHYFLSPFVRTRTTFDFFYSESY